MKVTGTNFPAQAAILWNGAALTTTAIDSNTLSGTIASSSIATPATVQLQVENTQTKQASPSVPLVIAAADSGSSTPLTISLTPLPQGGVSAPYAGTLGVSGGTAPYTWSIAAGQLPAGLTLAANTGIISGTPTAGGSYSFGVSVADSSSSPQSATATATISIAPPPVTPTPLTINSSSLPSGTTGSGYSTSLQASGGTAPYTWSFVSGNLPAGLSLNTSTGLISGTPTASGTSNLNFTVTDSSSPAQTRSVPLSLVVAAPAPPPLTISASLSAGTANTAYSSPMSASGGTPAYTWSITAGSLPAGLNLAATTGIISGTPSASGTFNFTVAVSDSSNSPQTKSVATSIVVAAAAPPPGPGTTWYVRPDGGTRYSSNQPQGQCDGKGDAPYSGSGVNQHCAFSDYRYLWDDQSYNNDAWVIAGGDTVIIRGCASGQNNTAPDCRVGWDAATGGGAGYTWCLGGGTTACQNPTIPAGTPSQHTRILGQNYANCGTATTTDRSKLTTIFGGFGLPAPLNLTSTSYVDVECIEITSHASCIWFGSPVVPSGCSGQNPVADFDSDGVHTDANTHDVLLQDMWIHGHTGRGVKGPIGGVVTALRVDISTNGGAGWDFDDGHATPMGPGALWNFLYSTIEWSGCNQEYPAVHPIPVASCYSQSTGGYGDGVGTPAGTGLSANIDHSQFIYNTQDGLDLGHVDTGGPYTLSITNSLAYGNNGGTFKWGPNETTAVITNNVAIANCWRMGSPIPGTPSNFNVNLADFCRANDAIPMDFRQGGTTLFANNTVVTYAPTTFDIACWDPSCSTSTLNFFDNIVVGYDNPVTYSNGGQVGGPGLFYFQSPIGIINRNNNIYYGIGHGFTCTTAYTGEKCLSPGFVGQPNGNGSTFVESELDNYNFHLAPGSPAAGTGITYTGVPSLDYFSATRPQPPSIGAVEP